MTGTQTIFLTLILAGAAFAQGQAPQTEGDFQSGLAAFKDGDCEAAYSYFEKVTDVDYYNDAAFFALARVSYLKHEGKDLEEAIEFARTAERLNPTELSYQQFLATLYLQRSAKNNDPNDLKLTAEYLKKILDADPDNSKAYLMLAHLYGRQNDLASEEKYLNTALSLDEENPDIYASLGILWLKRHPWENAPKAKEYFKKATSLDAAAGHYGMSYLYFLQDNKAAALAEYGMVADSEQRAVLAEAFRARYGNIRLPKYIGPETALAEYCKEPGMLSFLKKNWFAAITAGLVLIFCAGVYFVRQG